MTSFIISKSYYLFNTFLSSQKAFWNVELSCKLINWLGMNAYKHASASALSHNVRSGKASYDDFYFVVDTSYRHFVLDNIGHCQSSIRYFSEAPLRENILISASFEHTILAHLNNPVSNPLPKCPWLISLSWRLVKRRFQIVGTEDLKHRLSDDFVWVDGAMRSLGQAERSIARPAIVSTLSGWKRFRIWIVTRSAHNVRFRS